MGMWKIVRVSNYDNEMVDDKLMADRITDEKAGNVMVEALNKDPKRPDMYYYRLVPQTYKLHTFEP